MLRMRCRSRTICLSLAFITLFFHLLLVLLSLPIYHQPCDPPLPTRTHILRDLAHTDYSSVGTIGLAVAPTETESSNKDANKDDKGRVQTLSDVGLSVKEHKYASVDMPFSVDRSSRAEALKAELSKLKALFDHYLYNIPGPPVPEEDWLLRVKPKVKASERSSQMWVSASREASQGLWWNSSSHPPWLRFHLGISRWQLYSHRDPNMEPLTQQLATHRIVSAGVTQNF
ncbi:uncharacterized protein LOC115005609 [Cottoperca gobio]|uniref:Uncharacterized protein LOC115005609 n=1 Tax=Cottoperca gobio TaxID=56716 RepID=A0A6J2PB89_COTGO|nr:uncharacterized protein LOC115005609 [Cottoperca gobio]